MTPGVGCQLGLPAYTALLQLALHPPASARLHASLSFEVMHFLLPTRWIRCFTSGDQNDPRRSTVSQFGFFAV